MAELSDLAAVDAVLAELQQAAPPFVIRLPRQAGRKEQRYAQVFAGLPEFSPQDEAMEPERGAVADRRVPANERVVRLAAEVGTLRSEAAALRQEIEDLLAQFA